jgi:hypothetical protein
MRRETFFFQTEEFNKNIWSMVEVYSIIKYIKTARIGKGIEGRETYSVLTHVGSQ